MMLRRSIAAAGLCLGGLLLQAAAAPARPTGLVAIGIVTEAARQTEPASPLAIDADDQGLQGARLGLKDDATTGRFTGQDFVLREESVADRAAVADAVHRLEGGGAHFIVADLPIDLLNAALDAASPGTYVLNTRAPDDALRNEACLAVPAERDPQPGHAEPTPWPSISW